MAFLPKRELKDVIEGERKGIGGQGNKKRIVSCAKHISMFLVVLATAEFSSRIVVGEVIQSTP